MSEAPRAQRRPVVMPLPDAWPFPKTYPPAPLVHNRRAPKINPLEDREARHMGLPIRIEGGR